MREHTVLLTPIFKSQFASLLNGFLTEKRASGYKYNAAAKILNDIDRFLLEEDAAPCQLATDSSKRWLAKRLGENPITQNKRIVVFRQFALYLARNGIQAYIPHAHYAQHSRSSFAPRIFTFEEMHKLLAAVDDLTLAPSCNSPLGHIVIPEIFRVLCGCGLRISEALKLRVKDVNLDEGILDIHEAKFGKHRLVPMAPSITTRLKRYRERVGEHGNDAYFFPSRDKGPYHPRTIYGVLRQILSTIGLAHGGRNQGPRLHDLRHTYAVHRLIQWYREGVPLSAKIPILATYLGHRNVTATQEYLHLVPELFPEVSKSIERYVGHVIPRSTNNETD